MDFGIWAGVLELIPLGYQGTTAVCKKPSLRAKERQDRPGLLDNALRANSKVIASIFLKKTRSPATPLQVMVP